VSERVQVLGEVLSALHRSAARLTNSHRRLAAHFPLSEERVEALDEDTLERLDAYAIRYSRCQELLYPAMRALGRAQMEPRADRSFLDLFALMRSQGVVGPIEDWERQRSLRKAVAHEYPDATLVADILNGISSATPEILRYVEQIGLRASELG